jgi:hypothetical protein
VTDTILTKEDAAAVLKASAWTYTPGLDSAAPRLLAAVQAVWGLCHDDASDWLPDNTRIPIRDLSAVLEEAGELPAQRTVVHCRTGGVGADWDLHKALELVADAKYVEWSRSLFGHALLVVGTDGRMYRFEVAKPGEETRRA